MKKVLAVFLLAVLFSGVAFSQIYRWENIALVEDGGKILGETGVFLNNFIVEDSGIIYVITDFYSYDRRDKFLLEINILQEGKKTIFLGWADEMFKLTVTAFFPKEYVFPNGIDKECRVSFHYLFPKGIINFYNPFTIKYITVFDTTWHTYDMSKEQPVEIEYWRRNKRL